MFILKFPDLKIKHIHIAVLNIILLIISCSPPSSENQPDEEAVQEEVPEETSRIEEEHKLYRAGYSDSVNTGLINEDKFTSSPRLETSGEVGSVNVSINYGSPGKRGRVIWNGLVSYDQIWVSGSHWATAVTFSEDITVEGTSVPAGTYAFFTIPGREKWTLVLNERYDQHLADDYDDTEDVVRIELEPTILEDVVQRLTYEVHGIDETHGEIAMSWDQIQVAMPFEVK